MSTQSNRIEKTGKNVDEAIASALAELHVSRDMVDIEIIEQGSKGLFGILGGKDAQIVATLKGSSSVALATTFLDELFFGMGLNVQVDATLNDNDLSINLVGNDMGIIIGKRGETLDAIQYLTSLVVNKSNDAYVKVMVDTENYRAKRKDTLESLAARIADKVEKTGRRHILEPMNPYERRIIHAVLQNNEHITTHSIGEDPYRKVVVAPKGDRAKR